MAVITPTKCLFALHKHKRWLLIASLLLLMHHDLEAKSIFLNLYSNSQDPSVIKPEVVNYWKKYVKASGGDLTGLEIVDLKGGTDPARGPRIFITFAYNPPPKAKVNEFSYRFNWFDKDDLPLEEDDTPYTPLLIQPGERKRILGVFSNRAEKWEISIKQVNYSIK